MNFYLFLIITDNAGIEDIQTYSYNNRDEAMIKYHRIMADVLSGDNVNKIIAFVMNDVGLVDTLTTWERPKYNLNCMFENVIAKVLVNNEEVESTIQTLYIGDNLRVIANPITGYEMDYLRVNGTDILSGDTVEVTGDMLVEAKAVQMVTAETTES